MVTKKIIVRVDKDNAEIFYAEKVEVQEGAVIVLGEDDLPLAVFLTWQYWRYCDSPKVGQQNYKTWNFSFTDENTSTNYIPSIDENANPE